MPLAFPGLAALARKRFALLFVSAAMLSLLVLLADSFDSARADHLIVDPVDHVYTANFSTSGQSQIQPGPASENPGVFDEEFLFEWDISDSIEEKETV